MLSSILDDVKGEECRQSSAGVRGVRKYKTQSVFKVKKRGKYKVEGWTKFITLLRDEN